MRYKDLTGLRIGKLTVLEPTAERVRNAVVWKCRCDCGQEILVESRKLKPGAIYSCGCEESPVTVGKDLTGLRFGKLTVLKKSENRAKDGNPLWVCRCDCGNITEVTKRRLVTGSTRSCGCGRKPPLKDWVGKRFGSLTVLSYARKEKGFHIWHCKCDCGNTVDVRQSNLQSGTTTSCGCRRSPQKIGGYDSLDDAAKVRAAAEEKVFGDFVKWYGENYRQNAISPATSRTSV